ncbi:hypothetical protein GCM10023350_15770 [Nocardioides endophyticus]|uniref:Uncharacterized protein n=1 Tax=Nocardioides endophyticus TaxID=1353775 RepID=A0ABP8YKQ3_9ACTN
MRRRRRAPGLLLLPALLLSGSGCAVFGSDDVDSGTAEEALLGQRDAVAETARGLVAISHDVLGSEVLESRGGWEGCTGRFPEGYEDFRYTADVRLEAAPGSGEDVAEALRTIAEQSGYAVEEPGSADPDDPVRVTDGSVSASLMDVPDLGTVGDVLIRLSADPCVAVPEDEWQDWMSRKDPGPQI